MRHTALCIAIGLSCTRTILRDLRRSGFTAGEIAVIAVPCSPGRAGAPSAGSPREGAFARRWCTLVGAASGMFAGLEVDVRPGLCTTIGHGPLLAALAALADPPGAGGESGFGAALGAVGIPDDEARWIVAQLRPGTSLISVTTANGYEIETVLQIFREAGATGMTHASDPSEAAPPEPPPAARTCAAVPQAAVLAERAQCSA